MEVVARDSRGRVLFTSVRRVKAYYPVEVAEGRALLTAIKLAQRHGFNKVILESDCQVLVNRLSKADIYFSELDNVLEDISYVSSGFDYVKWSYVKKGGNIVAHHLAKLVSIGVEQDWVNHCPREVSPYVLSDNLSLD
ncbi:uncharacterized protein LOC110717026 [Chenopodium quinoa]|uniref:uncharacterized protein LOC110717026 n=1 Tax=Chenopodium quinoa TaxID=63459 RepID=UPI000B78190C|nr:uncharacterized protein LOC110717026 [Chenopodium quinoa]